MGKEDMFKRKKQPQRASYDKENQIPVLKCSICNGEQVAGFKDIRTGKFEEIMLISKQKDLDDFKELYGIDRIEKQY